MAMHTFPSSTMPLDAQISVQMPKPLGLTAGVFVHESARLLPQYYEPIDCDMSGKDKDGKEIAVNTVGRWLFGVPGYQGHVRIVAIGDNVVLHYPTESPELVHAFLLFFKEAVETGNLLQGNS